MRLRLGPCAVPMMAAALALLCGCTALDNMLRGALLRQSIALAGGGGEGEIADESAWSHELYKCILQAGDVTGDKRVTVAVLSAHPQTGFIPNYFKRLGADEAVSVVVETPETADDPALDEVFARVDAVFIKGGDQGRYYDLWHGRRLERLVKGVRRRGGGVGGTSAGAMALAEYSLSGSMSLQSADVLRDSHTTLLDDKSDGGSGIHSDWFAFVPRAVIDTHVTQRGRLGRMIGTLARATEDSGRRDLYAIGLDARTGAGILANQLLMVGGLGGVDFIRATEKCALRREAGHPLVWTNVRMDRLVAGWMIGAEDGKIAPPESATEVRGEPILREEKQHIAPAANWQVRGAQHDDVERFGWVVPEDSTSFVVRAGRDPERLPDVVGMVDAHDEKRRAWCHEALFRALYERPGCIGLLIGAGGRVWLDPGDAGPGDSAPRVLRCGGDSASGQPEMATMVFVSRGVWARGLSPHVSSYDKGDGSLHAAALAGLTVHVLAGGWGVNLDTGEAVEPTGSSPAVATIQSPQR